MSKVYFLAFSFVFNLSIFSLVSIFIGADPAKGIASYIPLIPSGPVFAGLFGVLLSAWLLWGDKLRVAGFGGWQLGVFAGYVVWLFGRSYVWLIEAVLKAAFGENAVFFSSIIVMGILFGVMRLVSQYGSQFLTWVLENGEEWEQSRTIKSELTKAQV